MQKIIFLPGFTNVAKLLDGATDCPWWGWYTGLGLAGPDFLSGTGGGPWGNWGACGCLCSSPLVVLPNDIGQTGEKEKGKNWISANFS